MHNPLHKQILSTLCYSDIFDFPLTQEEIWKYLIYENSKERRAKSVWQKEIEELVKEEKLTRIKEYYCLKGREEIIQIRQQRAKWSKESIKKAQHVAHLLSKIPTIQLIGLSGSLAMNNSEKNGDIDLFFITRENTLWITRLCIILLLDILGIRRKKNEIFHARSICINMFLETSTLTISQKNLYTAHEVIQMNPLMSKNNTYTKFIRANKWINEYVPNANAILNKYEEFYFGMSKLIRLLDYSFIGLFLLLEPFARILQFWYMRNNRTTEIIGRHIAAFHPYNYEKKILVSYKKRLEKYKIG